MKLRIFTHRGFTLIELLVVIAIIGLLSSVVLASLSTARAKGRDAQRLAFMEQMAIALELYYDSTGHYPIANAWYASCWVAGGGNWIPDGSNYNWSSGYIAQQAHDPYDTCLWPFDNTNSSPAASYAYWSDATGQMYALAVRLEDSTNRNTVQNAATKWFDGVALYGTYNWYARTAARLSQ